MKKLVVLLVLSLPVICAAQNVGIGTVNPTGRLHIDLNGTTNANAIIIEDDGDPLIQFSRTGISKGFIQSFGDDFRIGTYPSNPLGKLIMRTNNVDRLFITPTGNIGIGISEPAGRFQIGTGSTASLVSHGYLMLGPENGTNLVFDNNEILARSNGNNSNLYLQNSGGNVYIGDATGFTSAHRLGVDGNAVITGNVRIGTTVTPSGYKLAVDGKAICTELLVRLVPNWPDYVFANNYKLPGLDEVEDFIKKNNHLPGIPSAKNIEQNGMNIGEMQKMQMEKIEELTLYIIELKKEIEKLKKQK